jgi:hypothetical protein
MKRNNRIKNMSHEKERAMATWPARGLLDEDTHVQSTTGRSRAMNVEHMEYTREKGK